MMARNEGLFDRILRGVLGLLIIASGAAVSPGGWIVELLGAAMLGTAVVGWCPLYSVLHVSTRAAKR